MARGDRPARPGVLYRIVHGENVIDRLGIAGVERVLGEAGVDMAEMVEVTGDPPPPGTRHGLSPGRQGAARWLPAWLLRTLGRRFGWITKGHQPRYFRSSMALP